MPRNYCETLFDLFISYNLVDLKRIFTTLPFKKRDCFVLVSFIMFLLIRHLINSTRFGFLIANKTKRNEKSDNLDLVNFSFPFLKYSKFYTLQILFFKKLIFPIFSPFLIIPYVEMAVTTRCSLKCKDCSSLIQYYSNPKDFSYDAIILWINGFVKCVDYIEMFRILGGEPLLHKELVAILNYLDNEPKIRSIQLVTNGTLLPNSDLITVLKRKKLSVYISNYGEVSRKIAPLIELLQTNSIKYHMRGCCMTPHDQR